jgi:ATP-binding cassette subfamily B protein
MMTRAVADIALVQRLISSGTILLVIMVFASLVAFSFMLYLSPLLTLCIVPPMPLIFFYAQRAKREMGIASREVQEQLSELGTQVQENFAGIRTIQAMVQEQNEISGFRRTNQAYADAFYRQARINSMMDAILPSLTAISTIAILGFGTHLVLTGDISIGDLTAFLMLVSMAVQPFRVAGSLVILFQRAAVASDRLFDVFERDPEILDDPNPEVSEIIRGKIEFRNLTFAYGPNSVPVLDQLNLTIERGESISIMGRVGSGKTTLLKQIVRMLDTPTGCVFVDDVDVCEFPLAQLRAQIALVPQDPFLFGEPLRDNLTYDDPGRAIDQIWQAAESADFSETVDAMPEKMQTLVGERGVTLSGGEKQRATLARGLIRHAPLLILDDCFSSVDTETEEHILGELNRLRRGRTTLLVSHRVSTARHSDRIVILDDGRIVEIGTHNELIRRGGIYAELERIQREGASESDFATISKH